MGAHVNTEAAKWIHRQNEFVRICIVAGIGTVASFITYEIVFFLNTVEPRATTSWTLSFTIGVFRQHHLQRWLAFPNTRTRYGVSLKREWLASILVLVVSAALNFLCTELMHLNHRVAWAICLIFAAGMEYCALKFFVFRSNRQRRGSG